MKNQNLGYRIRKFREAKDYSQEYMASLLNMTTSGFSKIERGITDPSSKRLLQIADILEVSISELFSDQVVEKAADKTGVYGFATKSDVTELYMLCGQLKEELEKLKAEIAVLKKVKRK